MNAYAKVCVVDSCTKYAVCGPSTEAAMWCVGHGRELGDDTTRSPQRSRCCAADCMLLARFGLSGDRSIRWCAHHSKEHEGAVRKTRKHRRAAAPRVQQSSPVVPSSVVFVTSDDQEQTLLLDADDLRALISGDSTDSGTDSNPDRPEYPNVVATAAGVAPDPGWGAY